MSEKLEKWIFRGKSRPKRYALAFASAVLLVPIFPPWRVGRDIFKMFWNGDFYRAVHASLWLYNHSYMRFNTMGLGFNIGAVLADDARKQLYVSRFPMNSALSTDHEKLVLSGLEEDSNSKYWREEFDKKFDDFHLEIKSYSSLKLARHQTRRSVREHDAIVALDEMMKLYESLPGKLFLISGTFLGMIREQRFLEHDYDIDLGCFYEEVDCEALMSAIASSKTFFIKEVCYFSEFKNGEFQRSAKPLVIKLIHSSYLTIDIFLHFEEPTTYVHGSSIHLWENTKFDLAKYDFYGMKCWGADDYDRYLTENYGDWRVEKKEFDCDKDTPNLRAPDTPQFLLYLRDNYEQLGA